MIALILSILNFLIFFSITFPAALEGSVLYTILAVGNLFFGFTAGAQALDELS